MFRKVFSASRDEVERAKNHTKSKVRAKVEHAIGVIKRVFGVRGAASRGARITRPTVERLTPIFRASSFCIAFGFAATFSDVSVPNRPVSVVHDRYAGHSLEHLDDGRAVLFV